MNRLRLRKKSAAPQGLPNEVQVYADASGALKHVASDGTVTDVGGAPGGGSQPLAWSTPTVINNAGIIALPTTNVPEVLAAPGAGKIVVPVSVLLTTDFTTAGYGGIDANGSDLGIYWDNGSSSVRWGAAVTNDTSVVAIADLTALLATSPARKFVQVPDVLRSNAISGNQTIPELASEDLDVMTNTHLILYVTNSGNFTGGNAANTLTVRILYATVTL